jgi:hypothetical protein
MPSIAEVQRKLKAFDTFARRSDDTKALQKKWHSIFGTKLTELSAKSFVTHYREMRSKSTRGHKNKKSTRRRRQYGGVAPLNYVMTPGADVSVYGRFPVEVDTDPGSIKDLDVYFQDALTLSCGTKSEFWPTVPANMGSNQVGAGSRTNRRRKERKSRKGKRITMRRRKQRGGDIFDTIGSWVGNTYTSTTGLALPTLDPISRPAFSTVYPNPLQTAYTSYSGEVPGNYPKDADPVIRGWDYSSKGTDMAIPPQHISNISSNFSNKVSPPLYSMSSPSPK